MKKNNDCELVKDLLPSYIDKLTSTDTNEFIESHIKNCFECKVLLDEMKKESTTDDEKAKSKKFVNFAKKYKKKLRIFKFIVLIFFALIIVHFVRNFVIASDIMHKYYKNMQSNNYHYVSYSFDPNGGTYKEEFYFKDGKYLSFRRMIKFDKDFSYPEYWNYYDGTKEFSYTIDEVSNIKYYTTNEVEKPYRPVYMDMNQELSELRYVLGLTLSPARITKSSCNGKNCYTVDLLGNGEQLTFFDRDIGVPVRNLFMNASYSPNNKDYIRHSSVMDFYIDLDVVTDDDLIVPNVEEFKPYDEVKGDIEKAYFDYYVENDIPIPDELKYLLEE